jgi:hypothetical protein
MSYRFRLVSEIKYGYFGDYMATWKQFDAIMRERELRTARALVPTAGPNNEVVAEFEYPDLATFEREKRRSIATRRRSVHSAPAANSSFRAPRAPSATKTSPWRRSAATEGRQARRTRRNKTAFARSRDCAPPSRPLSLSPERSGERWVLDAVPAQRNRPRGTRSESASRSDCVARRCRSGSCGLAAALYRRV